MIFDAFEQEGLLLNSNFKDAAGKPGFFAYRGDLVLIEGDVADTQGRRKPPVSAMRQVVALAQNEKLVLLVGSLDAVADLPALIEKYVSYLTSETILRMYIINAAKDFKTTISGFSIEVISLPEGAVWGELCDSLGLEKADFKGQNAAEKVMTVYVALQEDQSRAPELAWSEAQAMTTNAKRQIHGAI